MLKVKALGQDHPLNRPILSGITFGFWELELVFEVTTEHVGTPLRTKFLVKADKNRKDIEFEIGQIVDNTLTLTFFNPPKVGTSGLTMPTTILFLGQSGQEKKVLALMFTITGMSNTDCYQMNYEFYEGTIPQSGGKS